MANTRAENKTASAKDSKPADDAKDDTSKASTETAADEAKDAKHAEAAGVGVATPAGKESAASEEPSDERADANEAVKADIQENYRAAAENPAHPEEAKTPGFLPGGEVPVNAPGTDGLIR